jgi:hypothetical protein
VISQSIQRRTATATVALLRRNELRPLPARAGASLRHDTPDLQIWGDQVRKREPGVPGEDEEVLEDGFGAVEERHGRG